MNQLWIFFMLCIIDLFNLIFSTGLAGYLHSFI